MAGTARTAADLHSRKHNMISQGQFNRAMQEINDSYGKMAARVGVLEERIAQLEKKPEPEPKKAPAKKEAK